jgi:cyclophilin family peptidyl-prolyl cis-trans isomerase
LRRLLWLLFALALALPGCGSNNPVVVVDTSMGTIKIELFENDAPKTVQNFLKLVDEKHYDNTIFHRVIKDFMIQGGGITPDFKAKPGADMPIKNESYNGLLNTRGTVAMARTKEADSATDQFFINVKDNAALDRTRGPGNEGYCVFGKVIEGMDVVDRIRNVPTKNAIVTVDSGPQAMEGLPNEAVIIRSIRRADAR